MCVHLESTAGLTERRGGGASNQWLFKSHLSKQDDSIKQPPTDINHVQQTHTVCHQSVSGSDCHTLPSMPLSLHTVLYSPLQSF